MKVKGITIWELHLEKIIIGLALLIFVGFTAWQFIGDPNSVEIAGTRFTPGTIDQVLQQEAESLEGPLSEDAPSPIPDFDRVEARYNTIVAALRNSVVPQPELPAMIVSAMPNLEGSAAAGALVNVPVVPQPYDLRRNRYFDSVVDEFVSEHPAVQALFSSPPYDIQFTTVGVTFPLAEMKQRMLAAGPDGEARVPVLWHNNQVHIIDVWLERQELIDGEWADDRLIDPIPTQFSYREEIAKGVDRPFADKIINQLTEEPNVQFAVIQPPFLPLENNRWSPPTDESSDDAGEDDPFQDPILREIAAKQRSLADYRQREATLLRQLADLGGPLDEPEAPRDRSGGRGSSGGSSDDEFGSGGQLSDPSGSGAENQAERIRMTKGLRRIQANIERLERELEALGVHIVREDPADEEFDPVEELKKDEINIWAHDLTVQSDRTYRYRLRVDVYNPLFGRKLLLKDEQSEIADQFTLDSEWSEWSQPIQIQRPLEVFVTNANAAGSGPVGGSATARVEVYRFYDGRWWREDFSVSPGERIGGVKQVRLPNAQPGDPPIEVDFTTNWFVLDVVQGIGAGDGLNRGMGSVVYLQSLTSPEDFVVRLPDDERTNPDRRELEDEARFAADLVATR